MKSRSIATLLLACLWFNTSRAEVTRIEITERLSFADGKTFDSAGAYERIKGRMFIETDPANQANERISDLQRAPRNARGKVESWTDFFLLKPVDATKGNGVLLYDVNNRGNMLALWTFNDGERTNDPKTATHAGNGFLMRHGFSLLWCGWNGEVQADDTHRLLCGLPIATENGKTITGGAHLEITSTGKVFSRAFSWSPWGIGAAFPSVSLDNADATLTMRPHRGAEGVEVPRDEWALGRWENDKLIPDATHETLLVLDATIGQNALDQAQTFHQFTPITGVILTKLDGSAKGGIAAAVHKKLGVPILWAGLGEGAEDLVPFDPKEYVEALFKAE